MFAALNDLDGASPETSEVEDRGPDSDSGKMENGALSDEEVKFTGKKKAKGKKGALAARKADESLSSRSSKNFEEEEPELDDILPPGKKKKPKGKKGPAVGTKAPVKTFAVLNELEGASPETSEIGEQGPDSGSEEMENGALSEEEIKFEGKKKAKGKKGALAARKADEPVSSRSSKHFEEDDLEIDDILPPGKKKSKGKKGPAAETKAYAQMFAALNELDGASPETSDIEDRGPDSGSEKMENGALSDEEVKFEGKKKAKGKKGALAARTADEPVSSPSSRDLEEDPELDGILFTGKKKPKGKKVPAAETEPYVEDEPSPTLDSVVDGGMPLGEGGEIVFSGKKKPKKDKKKNAVEVDMENTREAEEGSSVTADIPGSAVDAVDSWEPSLTTTESFEASEAALEAYGAKKKKGKKGKKTARSAQEEEDLDAILAELGGPPVTKPASQSAAPDVPETSATDLSPSEGTAYAVASSVTVDSNAEPSAATAEPSEPVESAAAKKKKKKKEKEKEKKAASVEKSVVEEAADLPPAVKPEGPKGKAAEKKVPKHLKAMQEQLQKLKEAEEKRKKEEEERLRKEEEERLRVEELERQKEETKRRRKEREKEKLMQRKKEGKFLTGKQKEEARRLAVIREQMLSHSGLQVDVEAVAADEPEVKTPRKPIYTNKKRRGPNGQHGTEQSVDVQSTGPDMDNGNSTKDDEEGSFEPMESMEVEEQTENFEEIEEEKLPEPEPEPEPQVVLEPEPEEEEEDWDAKSFEAVALPAIKSAFAEDEVEDVKPEVVPAAAKVTKRVVAQAPKRPSSPEKRAAPTARRQQAKAPARKAAPPPPAESEEDEDDEEEESEEETDTEEDDDADAKKKRLAKEKREARKTNALTKRSADDLRSPICCILGHVDTGKTKLLDCIRRTNVQEGEAGGITQQIGATYFPMENIRERTKELKAGATMKVPGLLVIDTPGHESFTNLRARGSSLCDIAILVVDIMHGLEPQTIESLKLLQMRKTPFVVALNKVDRLYDWRSIPNGPIRDSLKLQGKHVVQEFESRTNGIIGQLKEQGMNSELYYKNKEIRKVVSIVPTSAHSGEGIPDLLMLLVQLTQKMMEEKLMYVSEVQCTVLEVKMIEGLGTTIDVVLVNGVLHEGDQIVVCGMQGPIVTNIRTLLTPHPMKELRVKGAYEKHKELKAAQGIKISAQGLEHAIAGTQLYLVGPDDDVDDIKEEAMEDMKTVMSRVDKSGEGVCVQASTLGSLEALLEFLKSPAVKIPVSGISIGPVHKKDVMRASVMLERSRKEYATILAFDVKVTQEAKELADEVGVKIFTADIIYHLFDQFTNYISTVKEEKRKESADEAVFPCVLKILPECVFNKKDPIIIGVDILDGIAKVGTPMCVPSRGFTEIGRIGSMEVNHKVVDTAKKGQAVAMKIVGSNAEETQKMFGRHFDHEDELVSSISRKSIDLLKENYREDLALEDWKLLRKLKILFQIP